MKAALPIIVSHVMIGLAASLRGAEDHASLDKFMAQRGYAAIHFKLDEHSNHYLIWGKVNGRKTLFNLDTGASVTAVDRVLANKMPVVDHSKSRLFATFGQMADELKFVSIEKLELEGTTIANQPAAVLNLHQDRAVHVGSLIPRSERTDAGDVVLGADFLAATYAFVNVRGRAIYVRGQPPTDQLRSSIDQSLKLSGFSSLDMPDRQGGLFFIQGQVNGHEAEFLLDSGAACTCLDRKQLGALNLSDKGLRAKSVDAAQNKRDLGYATVASLKLGDWQIENYRVATFSLDEMNERRATIDLPPLTGAIGPDILERSHAILDCHGRKLYVLKATK